MAADAGTFFKCSECECEDRPLIFACTVCNTMMHAVCLGQYLLYRSLRGECPKCSRTLKREATYRALRVALKQSKKTLGLPHPGNVLKATRLVNVLLNIGSYKDARAVICLQMQRPALSFESEMLCEVEGVSVNALAKMLAKCSMRIKANLVGPACCKRQRTVRQAAASTKLLHSTAFVEVLETAAQVFAAEGNKLVAVTALQLIVQNIRSLNKIDSSKFEAALLELALAIGDAGQEFGSAASQHDDCLWRQAPLGDCRRLNALRRVHEYILQFLNEHCKITVLSLTGQVVLTTQLSPTAIVQELRSRVATALNWACRRLDLITDNGRKMKQFDVLGKHLATSARVSVVKRSLHSKPKR